ncbi:FG-GAP repeat domain-containing protein [Streptomyces zaomyceticus]|uniref:FG-GAP repeat domain-containing protein n=1 Tax=Streptomyces zaomyceticus TaxID=68286 RepID=UPI00167946C1|nr:VCBS repeat-containing protein [Streptomyces zaomyceticus]GHG13412.1 hypothetical protein GCM10018791_29020 [Streptomyces zaomyceticus]
MINRRSRAFRGAIAAAAVTVAMAATAGTAFAAGDPAGTARAKAVAEHQAKASQRAGTFAAEDAPVETPTFPMTGVHKQSSEWYLYFPNLEGGFDPRLNIGPAPYAISDEIDVDNDKDGWSDGGWTVYKDGKLTFTYMGDDIDFNQKQVGRGWNIYSTVLSPGSIGGAGEADLVAVDKAGVLWSYLSYPEGDLTPRTRVGGGWDAYNQIAGQGDLTGDGKVDIVAKDKSGVLWLYKGTGNYKAPFAGRAKIGGGWGIYDRILSVGDLDFDGTADLIARKPNGDLFRYSGSGNASAPFQKPVKIGNGFQIYNLL